VATPDALRILQYADHFPDLEFALALVGVEISQSPAWRSAGSPDPVEIELDEEPRHLGRGDADGWIDVRWNPDEDVHQERHEGSGSSTGGTGQAGRPGPPPPRHDVIASILNQVDADLAAVPADLPSYRSVPRPSGSAGLTDADLAAASPTLRADLRAAVRVPRGDRMPDVRKLVDLVARAQPLAHIAMLSRLAPPRVVRILVDLQLRAGPYTHDVDHLVSVVRRLIGDDRLKLWSYTGSPDRGCGAGPIWTWAPLLEQPAVAATVLLRSGHRRRGEDETRIDRLARQYREADRRLFQIVIGSRSDDDPRPKVDEWHIRD
jgi:hypothetical protein